MFSKLKLTIYILTFFLGLTLASSARAVYPVAGRRRIWARGFALHALVLLGTFLVLKPAYGAITIRPMLNTGLVGYWSMDEGAGATIYDQSGNRNNGTASNSPVWADGKLGRSLSFDGTDDKVTFTNDVNSYLNMTNGSISLWYKSSNTSAAGDALFYYGNDGDGLMIYFNTSHTLNFLHRADYGSYYSEYFEIPEISSDSTWHHLTAIWNVNGGNETMTFTLDGVRKTNNNAIATPAAYGGTANLAYDLGTNYYAGTIDEVRIYNRALSATEVTRLYNLTKPKILSANTIGLVGYWSFDEGLGTKAGDMSGWGNNGTASGSPVWVEGKRGRALDFNGSSDNVSLPDPGTNSIFDITNELSIFAWIKPNELSGYNVIVEKQNIAGTDYSYIFDTYDNELFFDAYDGANPAVTTNNANLEAGQWYYVGVVFSWDQDTIKFYKNGAEIYQYIGLPNLINPNNVPIYMGGNSHDGGVYFDGPIDEVRIYNRALSATEVASLYSASKKIIKLNTSQNSKLTDGLVGMWSFNGPDISGSTALDRSGNGNNGTINGASIINGKVGQALKFDGSSNYVNVVDDPIFTYDGGFTWSVWIKPDRKIDDTFTDPYYFVMSQNNTGVNVGDMLLFWEKDYASCPTSYGQLVFELENNPYNACSNQEVWQANTWYHVAVTYDNSTIRMYIDGVQQSDTGSISDYSAGSNAIDLKIGSHCCSPYYTFPGVIDEARIYDRALTAVEIKRLYQMGK